MIIEKLSDNKKLIDAVNKVHSEPWPVFLSEDSSVKKYWRRLYKLYPEYQLLFRINSEYVGVANSIPIYWNGKIDDLPAGFDETIETIIEENKKPNTLCGLAVVISKNHLGEGNGRYKGNNFIVRSSTKIDNIKFRDRIIAKLENLLDIMKDKKIIKKILEV